MCVCSIGGVEVKSPFSTVESSQILGSSGFREMVMREKGEGHSLKHWKRFYLRNEKWEGVEWGTAIK